MKKPLFVCFYILMLGLLFYSVWFVYLWHISMPIYHFTKADNSYTVNMYTADEVLGHTLNTNTHGYYIWGHGDSVAIDTDGRGFRTFNDSDTLGGLLFFGDSFTLCEELETPLAYPYLVGNSLSQPVSNAAVSGYGYAQMVLKARAFIDRVSPQVVIFQVSPWLAERAVNPYMPALFFKVPSPYYNHQKNISPPLYISPVFELTQNQLLDKYRESPVGLSDKVGFVWHFTRPVFQKQYWEELKLMLPINSSGVKPLGDEEEATELALTEVIKLCQGRKLILLVMGYGQNETDYFQLRYGKLLTENVTVVNADKALWSQPNVSDAPSYERAYCFWHGDPPVLIDYHFNARANELIAKEMLCALTPQMNDCTNELP